MKWTLSFLPEAKNDLKKLSNDQKVIVAKAMEKVRQNPLPFNQGGYGKPLGNKHGLNLSGFLKIKIVHLGIRVVYKLIFSESEMLIIVIGARGDDEVYMDATLRKEKHGL